MRTDSAPMTPVVSDEASNAAFWQVLGAEGVKELGEIVFDFIGVVESGDRNSIRAFRDNHSVKESLGEAAQAYLGARLDEAERRYFPRGSEPKKSR